MRVGFGKDYPWSFIFIGPNDSILTIVLFLKSLFSEFIREVTCR